MKCPPSNSWLPQAAGIIIGHAKALDDREIDFDQLSVRRLTTMYFVASHLYYIHATSLMEDTTFDKLCTVLLTKKFGCDVYHKPDYESLQAGTGFSVTYPAAIIKLSDYIRGIYEKQS